MEDNESANEGLEDRDYSSQFIIELGAEFKFDGNCPKIIDEINYIRSGYIAYKAADGFEAYDKSVRAKYNEVNKSIHEFRAVLEKHETQDLATDMYFGARKLNEPKPQTEFPEITEFEKTRGKPYYLELLRLLRVLEAGVGRNIDNLSPARGRKKDYAIEAIVRRCADFWEDYLNRKFTVDYHDGVGLTQAFLFVQKLLNEIEEIPDIKIITAMRSEITNRNKSGF